MDEKLTKQEVAQFFNIGVRTVERMAREGRLPRGIRMGRKSYWWRSSLEKAESLMKAEAERSMKIYAKERRLVFSSLFGRGFLNIWPPHSQTFGHWITAPNEFTSRTPDQLDT